jgi:hypothetical protein
MAKKKTPELSPEAKAANAAGEARREKEAAARRSNAEKQKRFRDSMKAQGYREVKAWEKPLSPGLVKIPAAVIREETAGICERDETAKAAVHSMMIAFFTSMRGENENISPEGWNIYRDIETLLSPLGYKSE